MKPSHALQLNSRAVLEAARRFHVSNPRVFGSVLRGTDEDDSDLDLLVDPSPETTLFDLGGLQAELEAFVATTGMVVALSTCITLLSACGARSVS